MMVEQIVCKSCGEYAEVQINTEQYHRSLCYDCDERESIDATNNQ
jgi:formylmethanofuran dehydrogenase subunit E